MADRADQRMMIFKMLVVLAPWRVKRWVLCRFYGYSLHKKSSIGLAWVFPKKLIMAEGAVIGHLTVCKNLNRLELAEYSVLGRLNWVTGYPMAEAVHFFDQEAREPNLIIGPHSAITNRHIIDCTSEIRIGCFSTVGGFRSQILTHSINIDECRQRSESIIIGDYCFIGTATIILPGSEVPSYSVVAAGSVLCEKYNVEFGLYAGVPARLKRHMDPDSAYFKRSVGFVV